MAVAATSVAAQVLDTALALMIPATADALTATHWGALLRSLIGAAIWIAYFRSSERVKATFVVRRRASAAPSVAEPSTATAAA